MEKSKLIIIISTVVLILVAGFAGFKHLNYEQTKNSENLLRLQADSNDYHYAGTVIDGKTGKPLQAKILVNRDGSEVQTVECDSNGKYDVSLADGNYSISAVYPGYVGKGKDDFPRSIDIHSDTQNMNTSIELWPEATISGRVVSDEQGIPAQVTLNYQEDDSGAKDYQFSQVIADQNGNFKVDGASGGKLSIRIVSDGYMNLILDDIEVKPGEQTELGDIPLYHAVDVYGTITDLETKLGISGVIVQTLDAHHHVISETTSAEDGSSRIAAADNYPIHIAVKANGYEEKQQELSREQIVDSYLIALKKASTGLSLVINNITNREPIKTQVTITDVTSNEIVFDHECVNGFYKLDQLSGGPFLIKGVSYDKITEAVKRAAVGERVMLTILPFAKLNVQFVMDDNKPLTGQYRYFYKPESGDETASQWVDISENTVMITDLMPGTYWVEAHGERQDSVSRSREITIAMGETRFVSVHLSRTDLNNMNNDEADDEQDAQELANRKAQKKFQDLDEAYQDFMTQSFDGQYGEDLSGNLQELADELLKMLPKYAEIASGDSPEWGVAAMVNMGSMFQHLTDELRTSEIPPELPDDLIEEYTGIIEDYASQFETKGTVYYHSAVAKSKASGIHTEYTQKAENALNKPGH